MATINKALTPADSAYRLPSEPSVISVTPEMASDWLSTRNHPDNRPLSRNFAGKYQRDMEQGRWRFTPEGYIFDAEGYIISGQHRLKAQANSNITLPMWIFPNEVREEVYAVVDSGYRRNAAHMLKNVKYASSAAYAARLLAALSDGDRWGMPRYPRVTTAEVLDTFKAWPEITWYPTGVFNAFAGAKIPQGVHMAVLAQAARTEHRGKIEPWLEALYKGIGLTRADDPRAVLRHRYISGYRPQVTMIKRELDYAQIVKAWNAFALDKPINMIRVTGGEPLPKVEGFEFPRKGEV